jgi:hypothetical protein
MMARHENRYPNKYKGGYQAAAPQSALHEVHLSAGFSLSLTGCLLIRHRTNLQTELPAILVLYRRKLNSSVTLARDALVLPQPRPERSESTQLRHTMRNPRMGLRRFEPKALMVLGGDRSRA